MQEPASLGFHQRSRGWPESPGDGRVQLLQLPVEELKTDRCKDLSLQATVQGVSLHGLTPILENIQMLSFAKYSSDLSTHVGNSRSQYREALARGTHSTNHPCTCCVSIWNNYRFIRSYKDTTERSHFTQFTPMLVLHNDCNLLFKMSFLIWLHLVFVVAVVPLVAACEI